MIDKLLAVLKGTMVKDVGGIVDNLTTSDNEKSTAKNELSKIITGALDKVIQYQSNIIIAEIGKGSWLTSNWRPIIMLMFGWIIFYYYFISPVFGFPGIALPDEFWGLLKIGLGGYVVGRSVEKVADTVTKNIDIPFLRKKDRNN